MKGTPGMGALEFWNMKRDSIAKKVRIRKMAFPHLYCADPRCLWSLQSGPCPKHEQQYRWVCSRCGSYNTASHCPCVLDEQPDYAGGEQ